MNSERETSSPDPLDAWLAQARWPEPSSESTTRLRRRWLALRGAGPSRELLAPLAAAAVVALAIGVAWLTQRRPPTPGSGSTVARSGGVNIPARPARPALLVGRPPTVLESMMIRAAEAREKKRASATKPSTRGGLNGVAVASPIHPPPPPPPPPQQSGRQQQPNPPPAVVNRDQRDASAKSRAADDVGAIVSLLRRADEADLQRYLDLVADPARRRDALAALSRISNPPTQHMLAALNDPVFEHRLAAALVLGRIDGPVLTRRLIAMAAADQNRREALIALASSRGKDARAFVERAAQSSEFAGLARSTLAMNEIRQTPSAQTEVQ